MEKLRTALRRFTIGLSDADELRSVFRDYLREQPEQRDTVAEWLAESIRAGRAPPAVMLTLGDLLALPNGGPKASPKPPNKRSTSAVAVSMGVAGTSDFDRTVYPQPVALSPGVPAPVAPSVKPDAAKESRLDPVLSVPEPARLLPISTRRPIDPATATGMSLVQPTNIGPTAEAMAADAEASAKVGDVLDGRYTLVMELGRGGMGT